MKEIFTLLVVLSLAVVGYGQSFKNTPLISKRTADWCTNCGSWGWTFKTAILDEISAEDATIVVVHYSGGLASPISTAISNELGGFGQPVYFLNSDNINASSGNWDDRLVELKDNVTFMNAEIPDFGIDLHGFYGASSNEIVAEIDLYVNQAVEGEYYIGTYLLDNKLISFQAGSVAGGSNAEHKKVILDEFSGEPFGRAIGNGPILEGVMNFNISATFDAVPAERTDIAVIVWEKIGDDYSIVNTAVVEDIQLLSSTNDFNWVSEASARFMNNEINVALQSEEAIGEYQLRVIDMNGRVVTEDQGTTLDNNVNIQVDAAALTSGNYFVNFLSSNGIWSEKVIVLK